MAWFLYLIECVDNSIYTGIATDVQARYAKHLCGKGARYTRSHPPRRLLVALKYPDRSSASKAEYVVKQLTPQQKRIFCEKRGQIEEVSSARKRKKEKNDKLQHNRKQSKPKSR